MKRPRLCWPSDSVQIVLGAPRSTLLCPCHINRSNRDAANDACRVVGARNKTYKRRNASAQFLNRNQILSTAFCVLSSGIPRGNGSYSPCYSWSQISTKSGRGRAQSKIMNCQSLSLFLPALKRATWHSLASCSYGPQDNGRPKGHLRQFFYSS